MILSILLYLALPSIIVTFLLMLSWILKIDDSAKHPETWPRVTVWVAARNEEHNIERCVHALAAMDYPKDKLEIILGNDDSDDNTWSLMEDLAQQYDNVKIVDVKDQLGNATGKANVLAHLEKQSSGKYYLITDADISVCTTWAKDMIAEALKDKKVGIITGATVVRKGGLWNALQSLDWIYGVGKIKTLSDFGIPVSAMGNNMLISKKAYDSTGGYEVIPFNITEDYELFKQVIAKKWKFRHLFHSGILAETESIGSIRNLLFQRKRWMQGGAQVNFFIVLVIFMHGLFYPAVVSMLFVSPANALMVWVIKLFVQSVYMLYLMDKLKRLNYVILLPFYEVYACVLTIVLMIFFVLPVKVVWKGRKY